MHKSRRNGHARRTAVAGAVALAVSLVAGCTGTGPVDEQETSFVVSTFEPASLIPGNTWAQYIATLMFTPPLAPDAETGAPSPAAASSVTSDDQKTWTIVLGEGQKFHNGEAVTAQSFVDGWNATANSANAWVQNSNFAGIEGYADLNPAEGSPTATELSGLTVVSDTEFTVTLSEPNGLFPFALMSHAFAPLPSAALEDLEAFAAQPIGNGPYQLAAPYVPNERIELTRFDDYAGAKGISDRIVFAPYDSQDTAFNDLLAGNVDVVYPVPVDRLSDLDTRVGDRHAAADIPNLNFIGFPLWDDRFADKQIRQAFSMAIDREALTSSILKGAGVPADAIAGESAYGATPGACEYCTFDPEQAQALLAAAGGWSGPLVLWAYQAPGNDQILQAIGNQLRQNLGIEDITYQIPSFAQYDEALFSQSIDGLYLDYWGAAYPHVASLLPTLMGSTGIYNTNGYVNDEFDSLIAQANALSFEESAALYQQAERVAWEDMPVMPVYFGNYTAAWSDKLDSVPVGVFGLGDLTQVTVTR